MHDTASTVLQLLKQEKLCFIALFHLTRVLKWGSVSFHIFFYFLFHFFPQASTPTPSPSARRSWRSPRTRGCSWWRPPSRRATRLKSEANLKSSFFCGKPVFKFLFFYFLRAERAVQDRRVVPAQDEEHCRLPGEAGVWVSKNGINIFL